MAITLEAVVTQAAREKWCKKDLGVAGGSHAPLSYFKIGEGGWIAASGSTRVQRTPDPRLTDLDCIVNPDRYPVGERYTFQKSFGVGDVTLESARTALAECFVDTGEGNLGTALFWELGVFDSDGTMVVYCTFREGVDKTVGVTIQRDIRLYR